MFSDSIALVSTDNKTWFAHIRSLMQQAGFRHTRRFPKDPGTLGRFGSGPLPFVFVDAATPADKVRRDFATVRAHAELQVRFLPIIVLSETRAAQTIMFYLELGCDDIITMPLTAAALLGRLRRQVGHVRHYFETESYFGPDRRQNEFTRPRSNDTRGRGDHYFSHFTIERSLQRGISIIDTEVHHPETERVILPV